MTDDQIEEQRNQIEGLILYLRDLRKQRSLDFVLFKLSEIAKESGMTDSLKESIKYCIENPDKELKVSFKKNEDGNKV